MRQIRFALYFALGLFLVTLAAIVLFMVQTAPLQNNVPFQGVAIDPGQADSIVFLPNRLFSCADRGQQVECGAILENQPLQITFDRNRDSFGGLANCRASYRGQAIDCLQSGSITMTPRGHLSYHFLDGNLGLTVDQLKALQQRFWLTNWIGTGKENLLWVVTIGMGAIGAALAIGLNWLEDNWLTRIFTSLSSGFLLAMLAQSFLGTLSYVALAQYGINDTTYWRVVLPVAMFAVGTIGTILTGLYVSRCAGSLLRGAMTLLMGLTAAAFIWFFFPLLGLLSNFQGFWLIRIPFALIAGIGSVVWLWKDERRSIKIFSCGMSALSAFTMLLMLLLYLSLNLGFAD